MKKSHLLQIIREVLNEDGAIGNVTGAVGGYQTPKAFAKKGQGKNVATKTAEHLGYKTVQRPKHPSNTKAFTYLDEIHTATPHAFVSETEMEDSPAVKKTKEIGYELTNKTSKASHKQKK